MKKALNTAWHNIRRSPYQAFAAIFIMMLTFIVISFFAFLIYGSSETINYFESKPQVTAFFRNEVKEEEVAALEKKLRATNKIASIKFVSKEDAFSIYKEQNKNDPLLLELVTPDILPASLEISTLKIEDLSEVNKMLKDSSLVSEVIFQKDVVSILTSWTTALRRIGIGLIVALSLSSIFIIVTIIGIKVSHKKEDIGIMRLIGAGSWYVGSPFILEGIFYGFLGAILGWGISTAILWYASPFLSSFLQGIPIFPIPIILLLGLLGLEILIAIILGMFSSFLAVLRYLK